jgi:hypothetical protein
MSTLTTINSAYASATGVAYAGPAALCGLYIRSGATGGQIVIRDGGASGTTLLTLDLAALAGVITMPITGNGIRFTSNIHVTLPAGATITLFMG